MSNLPSVSKGDITDITIGGWRYKLENDHLYVWSPSQTYSRPQFEFDLNQTAFGPIRELFHNAVGQVWAHGNQSHWKSSGILHDWVAQLGLRHQGCILSAIRGPDNDPKEGPSKWLVRFYRACVLRAHVGDARKAATFMRWTDNENEFWENAELFIQSYDHFHNHFVMHFIHGAEILGYKMPKPHGEWWHKFYLRMCRKLHVNPETESQMDKRLNKNENDFKADQTGPL